jgi:nicotinamide riboside kinase
MRIAVSGSFSVGKTSLCQVLTKHLRTRGHQVIFIEETARKIVSSGHRVDHDLGASDVLAYVALQLAAEREATPEADVVADRWLLDLYAYVASDLYLPRLTQRAAVCAALEEVVWLRLDFYQRHIYVHTGLPIVPDGLRDTNPSRQQVFAAALLSAYAHFLIEPIVFDPLKTSADDLAEELQ